MCEAQFRCLIAASALQENPQLAQQTTGVSLSRGQRGGEWSVTSMTGTMSQMAAFKKLVPLLYRGAVKTQGVFLFTKMYSITLKIQDFEYVIFMYLCRDMDDIIKRLINSDGNVCSEVMDILSLI